MKLKIGVAGTNAREAKYRPQTYLESQPAQDLICRLCQGPVPADVVELALREGLELVGAIRVRNGQCHLSFTCFLQDDIGRLNERGAEFGASLAEVIQSAIPPSPLRGVRFATRADDVPKYLFFLVGCVALDWHGLGILAEKGYTLRPCDTQRPGGGNFTLFGNELFERSLPRQAK